MLKMLTSRPTNDIPFDPAARLVDPETGLEYEDLAAKLLGRPEDSLRNHFISWFKFNGCSRGAVEAYWRAFDGEPEFILIERSGGPGTRSWVQRETTTYDRHRAGTTALGKYDAPFGKPAIPAGSDRTGPARAVQAPSGAVHAAPESDVQARLGP
jgi:hypothetical protein